MDNRKSHELLRRLLVSAFILAVYLAGRSLLLFKVDSSAFELAENTSQSLMLTMISGDRYRYSLFALGIMPYITSSLMVQLVMAAGGSAFRSRFSAQRMRKITLAVCLILALSFSLSRASELVFVESSMTEGTLKLIAAAEMTAGAFLIYKLAELGKDHGIGGQSPLILVNILSGFGETLRGHSLEELQIPLLLSGGMMLIILAMENTIFKIPVQRVSIHNTYADKSYIAFKLNPIGVMPVMFATAFFMIPQLLVRLLIFLLGENDILSSIRDSLSFTTAVGVGVYMGIVFGLTVLFSFVMLSPGDMADQLQKGGDSIVGVYAGRRTRRYIRRRLLLLSVVSGTVLSLLTGVSLFTSLRGEIMPELALLPSSAMMIVGLLCPLYHEVKMYRNFDSYRVFI